MSPELDAALVRDFPNLYRDRFVPMTVMRGGFDVPDAWEPIVRALSAELEALIVQQENPENFRAAQVKEKFGGLRFYMTSETPEMTARIRAAEVLVDFHSSC